MWSGLKCSFQGSPEAWAWQQLSRGLGSAALGLSPPQHIRACLGNGTFGLVERPHCHPRRMTWTVIRVCSEAIQLGPWLRFFLLIILIRHCTVKGLIQP